MHRFIILLFILPVLLLSCSKSIETKPVETKTDYELLCESIRENQNKPRRNSESSSYNACLDVGRNIILARRAEGYSSNLALAHYHLALKDFTELQRMYGVSSVYDVHYKELRDEIIPVATYNALKAARNDIVECALYFRSEDCSFHELCKNLIYAIYACDAIGQKDKSAALTRHIKYWTSILEVTERGNNYFGFDKQYLIGCQISAASDQYLKVDNKDIPLSLLNYAVDIIPGRDANFTFFEKAAKIYLENGDYKRLSRIFEYLLRSWSGETCFVRRDILANLVARSDTTAVLNILKTIDDDISFNNSYKFLKYELDQVPKSESRDLFIKQIDELYKQKFPGNPNRPENAEINEYHRLKYDLEQKIYTKRFDEAISQAKSIEDSFDRDKSLELIGLGMVRYSDIDKAMDFVGQMLKDNPRFFTYNINKAIMEKCLENGDKDKFWKCYEKMENILDRFEFNSISQIGSRQKVIEGELEFNGQNPGYFADMILDRLASGNPGIEQLENVIKENLRKAIEQRYKASFRRRDTGMEVNDQIDLPGSAEFFGDFGLDLAKGYLLLADTDDAYRDKTISTIDMLVKTRPQGTSDDSYVRMAEILNQLKEYDKSVVILDDAVQNLFARQRNYQSVDSIFRILSAYKNAGRSDKAEILLDRINSSVCIFHPDYYQDYVNELNILCENESKGFESAIKSVKSIEDINKRVDLMIKLIKSYSRTKKENVPNNILEEIAADIRKIENTHLRISYTLSVADIYVENNQMEKAKEILINTFALENHQDDSSEFDQLLIKMAEIGLADKLAEYPDVLELKHNYWAKEAYLDALACNLASKGNLKEALEHIDNRGCLNQPYTTYSKLANALITNGRYDDAYNALLIASRNYAELLCYSDSDSYQREDILGEIPEKFAKVGRIDLALNTLYLWIDTDYQFKNPRIHNPVLPIASKLLEIEKYRRKAGYDLTNEDRTALKKLIYSDELFAKYSMNEMEALFN